MSEIICPHCNKAFTVDESGYAALVKQVRDQEFNRDLERFTKQQQQQAAASVEAAVAKAERAKDAFIADKDQQIAKLQAELNALREAADRDAQAMRERAEAEKKAAVAQAELKMTDQVNTAKADAERLRAEMQSQKDQAEQKTQLALAQAKNESMEERRAIEEQLSEAKDQLAKAQSEAAAATVAHRQELEAEKKVLQAKIDEQNLTIATIRDMRRELSVKMLGENLEQYCENQFNALRPTAFQTAEFFKDNDASSGSKGDYIYREKDADGNELVSIMFEMKTETEDGAVKKKNADHFAKLDKDRTKKGCEYAVLVSELEIDNDLYESITDVSFMSGFDKMYVIRPKSFIAMITILRNQALKSQGLRQQLATIQRRDIDVTHFEAKLDDFRQGFAKSCEHASNQFDKAIKDIDATIKKLEDIKEELRKSGNHLNTATNKLGKLTRRSLSHGNPTVAAAFKDFDRRLANGEVDPYVPLSSDEDWDEPDTIQAELIEVDGE